MSKEAMKQALIALQGLRYRKIGPDTPDAAIAALKAALDAPSDADLERMTGEPHIDGYPLYSGLPTCAQGEPVAWNFQLFETWWDHHGFHNASADGPQDAKHLAKLAWEVARELASPPAAPSASFVDPTDPGHEVQVLREHVRHLERRIRELHKPAAPSAPPDAELARLRALVAAHREHPDCGDPLHPGCVDCEGWEKVEQPAAPQGGPAFYFADDGGAMLAIFRTRSEWEDFCADCGPLDSGALYTAPQPAAPQGGPFGYVTQYAMKWDWKSEMVLKVTRKAQAEYGFTVPLYATPPAAPSAPAGWIACSERMPDDGAIILATWADGGLPYYALAWMAQGKLIDERDSLQWGQPPTHWMPLPAPPAKPDQNSPDHG